MENPPPPPERPTLYRIADYHNEIHELEARIKQVDDFGYGDPVKRLEIVQALEKLLEETVDRYHKYITS